MLLIKVTSLLSAGIIQQRGMISSAINRTVVALLLLLAAQETLRVNVSLVTVGVQVTIGSAAMFAV